MTRFWQPSAPLAAMTTARCLIAGGGPAGMMLGYLLARAGVDVRVLEKHADFLRDFRGDTVHPSTLVILQQLGLLSAFDRLPQQRATQLSVQIGGLVQPVVDFGGLRPFDHLALVPQWDLLNLLAAEGRRLPNFDLRMEHEVLGTVMKRDRVSGVRVATPHGERQFDAALVVACDGRHSTLRGAAGLRAHEFGAPMDVLWFRLPRGVDGPGEVFAIVGAAQMMVLLDRGDYWQAAYVVPKGGDAALRERPIVELQRAVASMAPAQR